MDCRGLWACKAGVVTALAELGRTAIIT
jgi:hypothetical protein